MSPARAAKATGIRIREISTASDPSLRKAHAFLSRHFYRDERAPLRDWIGSLQEREQGVLTDAAWHLIVAERRGQVIGLTSGSYLGAVNIGVVGYLAISAGARAQGLGSRMRDRLRRAFERDAVRIAGRPLEAIVGEVSSSNPWLASLARRPAVLILDFPYFQPRLPHGERPLAYHLYYESLRRRRSRLPAGEVRRILYLIWRRIYRVTRPLDRAPFRAMLRALAGQRSVGRFHLN